MASASLSEPPPPLVTSRQTDALLVYSEWLDDHLKATRLLSSDAVRALQLFEAAVFRDGRAHSMYSLGCLLEFGAPGVEPNPRRAYQLYERAYKRSEHVGSMFKIAAALERGIPSYGVRCDPFRARALYAKVVAKQPHLQALKRLASLLYRGADSIIPSDPARAMGYYLRAAEHFSDPEATLAVGDVLIEGLYGWPSQPERALRLYSRVVKERSSLPVMLKFAHILLHGTYGVRPRPRKAIQLYARAVRTHGSVDAMLAFAGALRRGTRGVTIDCERAAMLYERAASAGSTDALFSLAYMRVCGMRGVPEDVTSAVEVFLAAISRGGKWDEWWTREYSTRATWENGVQQRRRASVLLNAAVTQCRDVGSMRTLAELLLVGRGKVKADPRLAGELYIRAINEASDLRATRAIADILLTDAFGFNWNPKRAIEMYNNAVEAGDVLAMTDLAHILLTGLHGIKADVARGLQLLTWAARRAPYVATMRVLRDALIGYGETAAAIELYTTAIDGSHADIRLVTDLADLLQHKGNHRRAITLYRRAAQANYAYGMFRLAEMLVNNGDDEDALRLCERSAGREVRARVLHAYLLAKRAYVSEDQSDARRVRYVLRRAVEKDQRAVQAFLKEHERDGAVDLLNALLRTLTVNAGRGRQVYAHRQQAFRNYQ